MARARSLALIVAGASSAVAGLITLASCLADPPPDLPPLPQHAPIVLLDCTQPPVNEILTQWPDKFAICVELLDPQQLIEVHAFIDYPGDPVPKYAPPPFQGLALRADGGIVERVFEIGFDAPDPSTCHDVEIIVASGFTNDLHTPNALGGETVHWIYNAGGGPNGCPEYGDAGDGSFPDVAPDHVVVPDSGGDGRLD
jgi:hypothetical protein